jgi:prepilin-type N-terminal cleavage/methylation domain-containing protein
MKHYSMNKRAGFTLIEIAIVILVIGLIIGGMLIGQHMVRISQVNSILAQKNELEVAISNFQERYMMPPGDLSHASRYWPTEVNGNGNGQIYTNESHHAWRHLAKAELISGNYTGTGTGSTSAADSPSSRINNVGWAFTGMINSGVMTSMTQFGTTYYDHRTLLLVGGFGIDYATVPFLTAAEAEGMDRKIDDGLPYSGNMLGSMQSHSALCTVGATLATKRYNVTDKTYRCAAMFVQP